MRKILIISNAFDFETALVIDWITKIDKYVEVRVLNIFDDTVLKAQNDLNYSLLILQQLINIPYSPDFNIKKIDSLNNQTVNRLDLSSFPELQLSDLSVQKQELNIKTSKSRLYPTLSINGSLGSGYSENNKYLTPDGNLQSKPFNNQLNENFYQSVSLTLTVPIFNKNINTTQIQINQLELEQLKIDKKKHVLDIQKKIKQLKMEVSNSDAQYKSSLIVLKANETNYSNNKILFENGSIIYSALLEVKNKLFVAESNSITSKYRKIISNLILTIYSNTYHD